MKYVDLIEKISAEDRATMESYISRFGILSNEFIGLDKWLANWSHSNQRLFKLLGGKFIHKVPYTFTAKRSEIRSEMYRFIEDFSYAFREQYHKFYREYMFPKFEKEEITFEQKNFFNKMTNVDALVDDKIAYSIKYKREGATKTLQLQEGMKPMRAFGKIVDYFPEWFNKDDFDKFRIAHSMILNNKTVHGNLCFSIHPMDFMTMSDNASNWSSCMSWKNEGCYRIGTVEMLNSNNVICCYLEGATPYEWGKTSKYDSEQYSWNNKKWRSLVYVTKDIIMSGKSYPYYDEALSKKIVEEVKKIAKENLGWDYNFGIEEYKDMKYIKSTYTMERARDYAKMAKKDPFKFHKHNILWDTWGMYNDMLNDHNFTYWCYRNKVDHTKVISVSGKSPCLCCGKNVAYMEYSDDDYNERYRNTGSLVCDGCIQEKFSCHFCGDRDTLTKHYKIHSIEQNKDVCICKKCIESRMKYCPCCGEPFYADWEYDMKDLIYLDQEIKPRKVHINGTETEVFYDRDIYEHRIECACCKNCYTEVTEKFNAKTIRVNRGWGTVSKHGVIFPMEDTSEISKYFVRNLRDVEFSVFDNVISISTSVYY